jgi:hypothetical protein
MKIPASNDTWGIFIFCSIAATNKNPPSIKKGSTE